MHKNLNWLRRCALAVLLLAAYGTLPASAQTALDLDRVVWSELRFEASKLIFKATTEIKLERTQLADVVAALLDPEERSWIDPVDDGNVVLRVSSNVLGRRSEARLWLAASDGAAYQRDELKGGRRYRVHRYAQSGVFTRTHEPASGERNAPHEEWSRVSSKYTEHPISLQPTSSTSQQRVAEPLTLLLAASAAPLDEPGDTTTLRVFSKGMLLDVELRVIAREASSHRYSESSPSGEREVSGSIDSLRIGLEGRSAAGSEDTAELELLGLHGEIEILLDPDTRIPLQISGKLPILGRVNVHLRRVTLR